MFKKLYMKNNELKGYAHDACLNLLSHPSNLSSFITLPLLYNNDPRYVYYFVALPVVTLSALSDLSFNEMSGKVASRVDTKCPNQSNFSDSRREGSRKKLSGKSLEKRPTVPPVARFKCFRFFGLFRYFWRI